MTDPDASRRRQLGDFLRARREATRAEAVGLPGGGRRRTPGLRREELADLAGISAVWYARIEQGREVAPSPAALVRLAEGLRLGRVERAHLFALAARHDPAAVLHGDTAPAPDLLETVAALSGPAYLIDRLWTAVAWNASAEALFAGWLGGAERNLLRYVFFDPAARDFIVDWDARARRLVAEFRADRAAGPDDAARQALIGELRQGSPLFCAAWAEQHVLGREGGLRLFAHPSRGRLAFRQVTLLPAEEPELKFVLLLEGEGAG
ncbi:transcriptional regulator [Aureimonas endophytica]|uniref:Transcriptional regulator n=1 Tax=Aureimonas endophytica TaxID=2027858 RepID=A0A917E7H7_9HYPH|nr:helix-turn-helix transcriptional regulator [Aureimonas endophytica]GGE08165.1 transcriptional regulator [Aureimonas endophytica]